MTMTKVVVMDGSTDREEAVVDPRTIMKRSVAKRGLFWTTFCADASRHN